MTKRTSEEKPLPTIWRTPEELWEEFEPILVEHDPPKKIGRRRIDQRAVENPKRKGLSPGPKLYTIA